MAIEEEGTRKNKGLILLAVILWAFTAIVGLQEFVIIRDGVIRIYAAFWGDYGISGADSIMADALSTFIIWPLGIVWIGFVIGGTEFHFRNFGSPKSWKLFAQTIAAEVSVLVLALYI
jgi:hypothetical protein